jgi:hypothetical protein
MPNRAQPCFTKSLGKSLSLFGTIPGVLPTEHKTKTLQLVASPSPASIASITVYANSIQQGTPVDPLYIEETDDWLGSPTSLETCRHQLRMYENEFEALNLKLERALENIQGLVRDNDALTQERNSLRAKLQYVEGDLLSENRRFADVAHQRDHLFHENQRLLREARDRRR